MHHQSFRLSLLAFALATLSSFPPAAAVPLSLAGAQHLAAADAPPVAAQQAALAAARQGAIGAGEQSDPKLIAGIESLPLEGPDRYSVARDGMTIRKIGFMQDFAGGNKLKLRSERAEAEVQRESAMLAVTRLNLRRDVALTWIERYFAERQVEVLKDLVRESELQVATAQATLAGGKGQAADPLVARLAMAQLADRLIDAERNVSRAQANLARWVGTAAKQPLDAAPAFDQLAHRHQDLTGNLDNHPHLAIYAPLQAVANADMKLASEAKRPDWSLEVAYQQRGSSYPNMFSVGVRIDLPIFQGRRQDPAIAAKVAAAEQVRAQTEDARRVHIAEIDSMLADWSAARDRVLRYGADLLPLARERTAVTLAAYQGGKAELAMVLEARRAEIEIRMNQLQAQADMARAWANLNYLLPDAKDPS
jgi:outer membrane protein TolC